MTFRGRAHAGPPPESPEALYRDLPRKPDAVPGLWLHQGDILRSYAADHVDGPDVALELPTGTGKTLPGLLIAEWVRRLRVTRVAYACPTIQLARQVAATAEREGVAHVVLVGPSKGWPLASEARYDGAEAVAIVTYNTIFNSSPKLSPADLLVFDDAHAGEQYVAEAYAVSVRRRDDEGTYLALLDAVAPAVGGMMLQRLHDSSPDPGAHHLVRLVVPLRHAGMVERIDSALGRLTGDQMFRYSMIRASLRSCLVYLTYASVLVRPLIPPTGDNHLFSGARQRVYLSATLGEGGEFERSFGRAPIARLSLPPAIPMPRSGRRFFVFPDLTPGADPRDLAVKMVAEAGKALVLAPDKETAVRTAHDVAPTGTPVLTIADVADGMEPFAKLDRGACGLAARYDGLDLPGAACRTVVLEGKPDQDNLQERFLSTRVRVGAALAERIRTRVVQGAGRCTRGPNDWALVVISGAALTKYLLAPDTLKALAPELQAEIEFGIENCKETTEGELLSNVRVFLEHGETWRESAEPLIAEYRREATRELPVGTDALAASVAAEIDACCFAASGRWPDAARVAQEAARALGTGEDATRGYRALWLYLAAVWSDQAGAESRDEQARRSARALLGRAEEAAKPGSWLREMAPFPETAAPAQAPADAASVTKVAAAVEAGIPKGKHDNRVEKMLSGLAQPNPGQYEPALTTLGTLLGAEAWKPGEAGRCDSIWCWQNALWIAVEAKSDHNPAGLVPHRDIRQANDQLRLLCGDRHQPASPPDSATLIVSPRSTVDPTGARGAEAHVHLVHPDTVLGLAQNAATAWEEILAGSAGRTGESLKALVTRAFANYSILATQVLERLTEHRVATG